MAVKKKSEEPNIVVKKGKNKPDVDIKIRNLGKAIKEHEKCCGTNDKMKGHCGHKHCGNCWIFGSALAMIISYERSTSILWAILHGALSWFYIIFRAMQNWGWIN